jgi:hypothetical protein
MKFDQCRLFPHPVLRPELEESAYADDYVDSHFSAEIEVHISDGRLVVKPNFKLSEPYLEELIDREQARYVLIVECKDTFFVEPYPSKDADMVITLEPGAVYGQTQFHPLIYVTQEVRGYTSSNLDAEWGDSSFDLSQAMVLAAAETRVYNLYPEEYKNPQSIMRVQDTPNIDTGYWEVTTDDEWIIVSVSSEQHELLKDHLAGDTKYTPELLNGLFLPALQQVLSTMVDAKESNEFVEDKWYRCLQARMDNEGLELNSLNDCASVAQKMFSGPLGLLNQKYFIQGPEESDD